MLKTKGNCLQFNDLQNTGSQTTQPFQPYSLN